MQKNRLIQTLVLKVVLYSTTSQDIVEGRIVVVEDGYKINPKTKAKYFASHLCKVNFFVFHWKNKFYLSFSANYEQLYCFLKIRFIRSVNMLLTAT